MIFYGGVVCFLESGLFANAEGGTHKVRLTTFAYPSLPSGPEVGFLLNVYGIAEHVRRGLTLSVWPVGLVVSLIVHSGSLLWESLQQFILFGRLNSNKLASLRTYYCLSVCSLPNRQLDERKKFYSPFRNSYDENFSFREIYSLWTSLFLNWKESQNAKPE